MEHAMIHRIVFFPILTVNQSKRSIKRLSQLCTNQNFRALARNLTSISHSLSKIGLFLGILRKSAF